MTKKRFQVILEPFGRRVQAEEGVDLLTITRKAGIDLAAVCGGVGICGTCQVRWVSGQLSDVTYEETDQLSPQKLAQGYRLACQAKVFGDLVIDIPHESLPVGQKLQLEGNETATVPDLNVGWVDLDLPQPALNDLTADLERINCGLAEQGYPPLQVNLAQINHLSEYMRAHSWQARLALRRNEHSSELAGIYAAGTALFGMAVDLGSTKIAVYLIDFSNGATVAQTALMNPLITYGEDIVSRISFANQLQANRPLLQQRLIAALNQTALGLCAEAGAVPEQIVDAVVVGNTAMHHFFCGLPVKQLGEAPYLAAVSQPLNVGVAELGLDFAPGAKVYLPANIAGYVGGDHTAALLAANHFPAGQIKVLVDIGTNTEISLIKGENIFTCSTASGPAFEGAHIHDGMRAAPGAIDKVSFNAQRAVVSTIDNLPAIGICGTGILSAIAEMRAAGVLDERGVFSPEMPEVFSGNGRKRAYRLVAAEKSGNGQDILVTSKDVHEIQLAKGAIRTGIEILLHEAGLTAAAVDHWIIAGAFGTFLDPASAVGVGMFPSEASGRIQQVGNAAGMGAKQMLLSRTVRAQASLRARQSDYIELTTYPGFTDLYINALYFPTMEEESWTV